MTTVRRKVASACMSICNSLWVNKLLGTSSGDRKALGSCAPGVVHNCEEATQRGD